MDRQRLRAGIIGAVAAAALLVGALVAIPSIAETPAPSAPRHLHLVVLVHGALVRWSAPATTGGEEVTGYRVSVTPGSTSWLPAYSRATRLGLLDPSRTYRVAVSARGAGGVGPAAVTSLRPGGLLSGGVGPGGALWSMGNGYEGELGDGREPLARAPQLVPGLSDVAAIAAFYQTVYVLKRDGSVWSWGSARGGALGNGTGTVVRSDRDGPRSYDDSAAPVRVARLDDVVAIAAGPDAGYALRRDGTVWGWGTGMVDMGYGLTGDVDAPVQLPGFAHITQIAAGLANVYAVRADGTVWSRGVNSDGELGDGEPADAHAWTAVQVRGITDAHSVAAGGTSAFALLSDGTVRAWGSDAEGALGSDETSQDAFEPVEVTGLRGVSSVTAGASGQAYAVADGRIFAWGAPDCGELGNGQDTTYADTPVELDAPTDTVAVAAGWGNGYGLKTGGGVVAWGAGWMGNLGDGVTPQVTPDRVAAPRWFSCADGAEALSPREVPGLPDTVAVTAGITDAYALGSDGHVLAWGSDVHGQLGNGSFVDSAGPVHVGTLTGVTAAASGGATSYALRSDGSVWAWGTGGDGQLGTGVTVEPARTPQRVAGLDSVAAIAAGARNGYALRADGTVWAWGRGDEGQLGDGTREPIRETPQVVAGLDHVMQIAAAGSVAYAVRDDGTLWYWGDETSLGFRTTPGRVPGIDHVVAIADAFALRADGTAWAWGSNGSGELGNDNYGATVHEPVRIPGLRCIVDVATGLSTRIAARCDGRVLALGRFAGTRFNSNPKPTALPSLNHCFSVRAVDGSLYAVREDGAVFAWGPNDVGQLGQGNFHDQQNPGRVRMTAAVRVFAAGPSNAFAVLTA